MKPIGWLVPLVAGLAACAPDSTYADGETCADGEMCGRVVEAEDARVSREVAVSLDVAVFWHHDDIHARVQYWPMVAASVTGSVPFDFSGALPEGLSDDEMIEIENPETGVADPGAGRVGIAQVYLTAPDAVDDNPEGVNAFDVGVVLGMARDVTLFYAPVDLDTTAGIRWFWPQIEDQAIDAGYHLFVDGIEVDLTTPIEAELGYVAA